MTSPLLHSVIRRALLASVSVSLLGAEPESPPPSSETNGVPAVEASNERAPAGLPRLEDGLTSARMAAEPEPADSNEPELASSDENATAGSERMTAEDVRPEPGAPPTIDESPEQPPFARDPGMRRTDNRAREDSRSFDRFRLVVDRNIFNSERRKPLPPGREPPPRVERPRTETISLNGTISYSGKAFAFVSSSESQYRGVFSPGDTLAGWNLAAVDTRGVRLEGDGGTLDLPVGKSLRREGTEPWEVAEGVTSRGSGSSRYERDPTPDGPTPTTATVASPAGDSGGGGGMSEILRRMMERRRQEQGE